MQSPIPAAAAFTAAQRAMANPAAQQAAQRALANPAAQQAAQRALANPATSRALAAGFQRAGNAVVNSSTTSPPPVPPSRSSSSTAVDGDTAAAPAINFGRVAAAAQAFSGPPRAANPPTHKQTDSGSGLVPQKVCAFVVVLCSGGLTAW
jgi:hypothetical protein